jgi:acid phosphatase type 7
MFTPTRRTFLGASLAGLATGKLLGADPANPAVDIGPFQPATLFLTWHRDPTTTMVIQWVGTPGETPDTNVYYTARPHTHWLSWHPQPTEARPFADTGFRVYRTELTGLNPGTDYQFKIGMASPTYRFRTMPAKATDVIHFISGGDCGVNQHAVANNQQAARQDPMFALIGGDLAYEDGVRADVMLAFLKNYNRTMVGRDGRLIPMVAGIGNHEVVGGFHQPRSKAPFYYALFDGLYPETGYATLDFGDYLSLVLLDTNHTTPIGGDQTAWLEKALKERADHPNVFVVNHVPAYPTSKIKEEKKGTGGEDNRKHWVPLFEKHRVPVVLEHHDHTFKRTKPLLDGMPHDNGVVYLGDGSWGRLQAAHPPEDLPYLATTNRDFHLTLHRIQGQERFHLALDESGRVMDVTRTAQRTGHAVAR